MINNKPQNNNMSINETKLIKFSSNYPIIKPISKFNNLDCEKKSKIFNLNYLFYHFDETMNYINNMSIEIIKKYEDAEKIIKLIEDNLVDISKSNDDSIYYIEEQVNDLKDLIFIANKYGQQNSIKRYNINVEILYKIINPLKKLNNVIGIDYIKTQIVDQILASLQNLYDKDILFHTIIKGPPGVGKTMLAKIIGELYLQMGIIKNSNSELVFNIARRCDLIGKYLGHTAIKTQEFINKCEGGIMFIDEVYSLGNKETKDNFSKECIDTINLNLLEKNFICIIAGYSQEIENCFFAYNPGLKRRFSFCYEINGYTPRELTNIFISKINNSTWDLDTEIKQNNELVTKFIETRKDNFQNYGGDIDTLILNTKIAHSRRVFGKDINIKKIINMDDIKLGYNKMISLRKNKNELDHVQHIYI